MFTRKQEARTLTDERFSATLELMSGQHQQGFSHKKTRLIIAGMLIVFGISWYVFAARDKYPVYPSSHSPTSTLPPIVTYTFSPSSVRRSSNTTIPLLEWQTYTDAKLRATFEYPTTWKLINTKSDPSQTGVGSDYQQNPKFQEAVAGYNHLIDSFTFTDERQTEQDRH